MSKIIVPELQYYYNNFIINENTLNRDSIPFPITIDSTNLNNYCFVKLLFDENWSIDSTSYDYLFISNDDRTSWPKSILDRAMIYPSESSYYNITTDIDTSSTNIFEIQNDDLTLLNKLLQYRLDSTSITLIDIDYNNLSTNLSKLIYLYLNLKINNDYSLYDNITLLCNSNSIIECIYESYIIQKIFDYISNKGR